MSTRLFELRACIDDCDRKIAELLARRSNAVADIAKEKIAGGIAPRDPRREQSVILGMLARMKATHGRYSEDTIRKIYAAIFDGSQDLVEAAVSSAVDGGGRAAQG